jgi:hypothetical protein
MAEKVIIHRIDDITGHHGEDVERIEFSIEGIDYEIDLSADNAAKLRDTLSDYIEAGRKATAKQATEPRNNAKDDRAKAAARKDRIKDIREWAKGKFDLADRGRIPLAVEQAYDKAMKNGTAESPPADDVVDAEILDNEIVVDNGDNWQSSGVPVAAFSG